MIQKPALQDKFSLAFFSVQAERNRQGCSVLNGNALIRPVIAKIASTDLKSPSYQDLILVSPSFGVRDRLN
jgi:hypothetical protein